ncbi:sigma factor [Belnapia rosea]|uniref:DNA-directed RNA polymerase specialized sigma subunit, sigma24 family n=1 Tax=Belnapia rosea TaxID=938405 RepID=A0A1G6RPM9_9PROT|nr:sigma factor [Belnapia rosea]SDD06363.1 DNA-directed RNA polymerase specialized sigma subunit, sigma24 family [Belnapia rosea]
MDTQRPSNAADSPAWDRPRLQQALSTARYRASRGGRRLGLAAADREDLCQDILVALLQRSRHFDPARGAWSTFVGLVARHVVADRARLQRERPQPVFLSLDLDGFPSGCSATQQDHIDPAVMLDLQRVAEDLPAAAQSLLRLLGAEGDVPSAQLASPQSRPTFYRSVADLRCWLHASGLRPQRALARAGSVGTR